MGQGQEDFGPYRRAPEPAPLELPPAVAAAREELRRQGAPEPAAGSGAASSYEPASSIGGPGSSHNGGVPGTPGPSHSCGAPGTPMPGTPSVRRIEVVTEAGEERFRVRDSGPWVPNPDQSKVVRGSARLAEDIAGSTERVGQAVENFRNLIYAPSTSASKEALFALWCKISRRRGLEPLPLTPKLVMTNSAVLREAGYRSVMSYVGEARERHSRAGYAWGSQLQSAYGDARRASRRTQGETKRAEEIKFEWWTWLIETHGRQPLFNDAAGDGPKDVMEMVAVSQHFLLREVEASSLFLDRWCLRLDEAAQTAGLFLPVSKVDQQGSGVLRTLACVCKGREDLLCPYHSLRRVVRLQLQRFGFVTLDDVPLAYLPLFGQKEDPSLPVTKVAVVKELQRLAAIILGGYPSRLKFNPSDVTGHTWRRSGIKALGRRGLPFSAVQWLARHSSNVTAIYLEEAYEEMSRGSEER